MEIVVPKYDYYTYTGNTVFRYTISKLNCQMSILNTSTIVSKIPAGPRLIKKFCWSICDYYKIIAAQAPVIQASSFTVAKIIATYVKAQTTAFEYGHS